MKVKIISVFIAGVAAGALLMRLFDINDSKGEVASIMGLYNFSDIDAVSRIREGKSSSVVQDFDNSLSRRLKGCDKLLQGELRLNCLWALKDYVVTNSISITPDEKKLLDDLPVRPLTSCEANGTCPVRPSAKR